MLLTSVIVLIAMGVLLLHVRVGQLEQTIARMAALLSDFDKGAAASFDSVDSALRTANEKLAAIARPRCESGNCSRPAVYKISQMYSDSVIYTCAEHDIWRDSKSVFRDPIG